MSYRRLENYLKTYRRASGLSQDEVAFLLGVSNSKAGTMVVRHERRKRQPTLETALAYEVIFRAPARELFAGVYEKVERKIVKRAQVLAGRLPKADSDHLALRKLLILKTIAAGRAEESVLES